MIFISSKKSGSKKSSGPASKKAGGKKGSGKKAGSKKSGGKKSGKRRGSSASSTLKTVVGQVLAAAAVGAVKGAVVEAIPTIEKAAGVTETDKKEQQGKK